MMASRYQQAIYDAVATGEGDVQVDAKAGSGKTTTILESLKFIPQGKTILVLAFNRLIANELQSRVPVNVKACTFNSYGWAVCRQNVGWIKCNENKTRNILFYKVLNVDKQDQRKLCFMLIKPICRLVSHFKMNLTKLEDLTDTTIDTVCLHYLLQFEREHYPVLRKVYEQAISDTQVMDFDDQIYFPVRENWLVPIYDYVFVDEVQDLNYAQIQFVKQLSQSGRLISVGDRHQAIYGFRGANTQAFDILGEQALHLPLSISYRCSRAVVEAAQSIVPEIEYKENAEPGSVSSISEFDYLDKVKPGDFVLCRINAPLFETCFALWGQKIPAYIRGRDVGSGLLELADKIFDITDWDSRFKLLDAYIAGKREKLKGKPELQIIEDQVSCLAILCQNVPSASELRPCLEKMFDEGTNKVMLSTVHRAKGLEAHNVFIIKPELMPWPNSEGWQLQQEYNIKYVAITRAKTNLYWVR